ncbi:pyridoxamine 5-phosphate oxidase, partial [Flavobacteriaceae bacterium]|nr:pyridoxamine 5-phosphate oxidase [Flavobacteriaceae bacterium]
SWFGFSIIINERNTSIKREDLIIELENSGIETRPIVSGNFVKNKVLDFFEYEIFEDLPNTEILDKNGFFVGNHHYDLKNELEHLNKIINKVLI